MFWYHADLERLEKKIETINYKPKVCFFGSSTFTLWNAAETVFEDYNAINLGFGGSTLASCTWFFERIFKNINSIDSIIIYAGDNDLGEGRHPEEVVLFYENLVHKIKEKYGNIKCSFISIKPSIARRNIQDSIHYTNKCIQKLTEKDDQLFFVDIFENLLDKNGNPNKKYFEEDGLHFSEKGYAVLTKALQSNKQIFTEKILEKI
jgi:lysophospholipase L1-like esterase